jgi:alkanesulfonate monooxygenase SsuD/methylene tetrahydromethanopterin reductase-like flavin-dependent oxidoreductase (luciferase family)
MKFGFVVPGGDVAEHIKFAEELEAAEWDAVFVADGVYGTDPWVSLAACAVRTERIRLGTLLTPVSRRRPWKLASELATLDRLSNGRAVLCAGLGATDTGFDSVGEATDRKVRAQLLDEGLELVTRFWSGKPFKFTGQHYKVNWGKGWLYTPVQQPRIPIWVVGAWPRPASMRRPLRYDGLIAAKMTAEGRFENPTPEDIRDIRKFVDENRTEQGPFDIIVEGVTPIDEPEKAAVLVQEYSEAGATWWIESMWDTPGGMKAALKRAQQGPPRID